MDGIRSGTKLLLMDDNKLWAETWAGLLVQQGFQALYESDPRHVKDRLLRDEINVVLLDLVMEVTPEYDGIDVLMDIMTVSPKSKVIVVTGTGTMDKIVSAIERGACAVIDKRNLRNSDGLQYLVREIEVAMQAPKLKNSPDVVRENVITALWNSIYEGEAARKGERLEKLAKHLFESLPGFYEVRTNFRSESQQIDLVINHRNSDPFWHDLGGMFIGECKNWSQNGRRPQSKDFASFILKLDSRGILCKLGFFISLNGYSKGFLMEARAYNRSRQKIVVPLDGEDLESLIDLGDGEKRLMYIRTATQNATAI